MILSHKEKAMKLFEEGYNCCQSVVGAFAEETGLPLESVMKMASSFGGGMGRLREVCGAVSGMFFIVGIELGYSDPKDYQGKKEHYERIQKIAERFRTENGSIVCRELLGLKPGPDKPVPEMRTEEYYKKRPCKELIGFAAEILEQALEEYYKITEN